MTTDTTTDTTTNAAATAATGTTKTRARRRLRLLLAVTGLVALSGCSDKPFLCAQLGTIGLCA